MPASAVDPWSPGLAPGGAIADGQQHTERLALDWAGVRRSFADLTDLISMVDTRQTVDVTGLAVPDQLAGVFAAAAAGVPVVLADPANPLPSSIYAADQLPPGAFLMVSTSGSTGRPRAVVRTLRSWTASFDGYSSLTGLTAGDRLMLTGPLSSSMQLFSALHALWSGAGITDDPANATSAVCVPTLLPTLIDPTCPTRLRTVVVAGARVPQSLVQQAISTDITVIEYYGAAELSLVAARRLPAPLRPFPGVEILLRDGQLWSRSEFHALDYLGGGSALRTDPAGYATVGDLAMQRADGSLLILGRGNAAVTVGGRTVIVEDVEAALVGIPGILDAAVIGLPHPRFGEELVAVVTLDESTELASVRSAARILLHGEALPRRWRQAPFIPRTRTGKIDRVALRWQYSGDDALREGSGT